MKNPAGSRRPKSLDRTEEPEGLRVDRLQEMAKSASNDIADDYLKVLSSGKKALRAINEALSDAEALERRIRFERFRPPSSSAGARVIVQVLSTARERLAASLRRGDKDIEAVRRYYDDMSSETFR